MTDVGSTHAPRAPGKRLQNNYFDGLAVSSTHKTIFLYHYGLVFF